MFRRLYEDVKGYPELCEKRRGLEKDLERVRGERTAAWDRLRKDYGGERRAAGLSSWFDKCLKNAYESRYMARRMLLDMAEERGQEYASEEMRRWPERFGELRLEHRRRLGFVRIPDSSRAKREAAEAAYIGVCYLDKERRLMPKEEAELVMNTRGWLGDEMDKLLEQINTLPKERTLLCSIGDRMAELSPSRTRLLERAVGGKVYGTLLDAVFGERKRQRERHEGWS